MAPFLPDVHSYFFLSMQTPRGIFPTTPSPGLVVATVSQVDDVYNVLHARPSSTGDKGGIIYVVVVSVVWVPPKYDELAVTVPH